MGLRSDLSPCLDVLQRLGCVQLERGSARLSEQPPTTESRRRIARCSTILEDVEVLIARLRVASPRAQPQDLRAERVLAWARLRSRLARRLDRIDEELEALAEEGELILKYLPFLRRFVRLLPAEQKWPDAAVYHLLLRSDQRHHLQRLEDALRVLLQSEFQLIKKLLPDGTIGLVLIVSAAHAADVQRLLSEAQIQKLELPSQFAHATDPLREMRARLQSIRQRTGELRAQLRRSASQYGAELRAAQSALHDWLALQDAIALTGDTGHAFVLEGWTPGGQLHELKKAIYHRFGEAVVVEAIARTRWQADHVPVVLTNPRLFQPFEILVNVLPLPRYGSIDPTPFVAVFFPVFVGIIIGDVGYGAALVALALLLRFRSRAGTPLRSASEIAGVCALFAMLFGFVFGELLGDLGRTMFGMRPLLLGREEALLPFLYVALGLGLVHILLGLVIGIINAARHEPRLAIGRGITATMLVLIVIALLALLDVLPQSFFTPASICLLICFPLLIAAEGLIGAIEFFSTIGNVLSYARVMAIGTASVIMAVAANRMSGAMGSVVVGVIFALLFHIVNFALALFTPTIHGLRLHYVEFFRQFYSPGGSPFEPLARWRSLNAIEQGNERWSSSGWHSPPRWQSVFRRSARPGRNRKSDRPAQRV